MSTMAPTTSGWFNTVPVSLADGVEFLVGADEQPLLFDRNQNAYFKLSPGGVHIVKYLDGTRTGAQVVTALTGRADVRRPEVEAAVGKFLTALRDMGVLNPPGAATRQTAISRRHDDGPMFRIPIFQSMGRIVGPIAAVVRRVPMCLTLTLLALSSCVALLVTISAFLRGNWPNGLAQYWMVLALFCPQLITHEFAHAVVAHICGVPVREAGVGLLYYVIPVAYVDDTDTYRLRNSKQRAAIAAAGPLSDLFWAGGWACVAHFARGELSIVAHSLLLFQLPIMLYNLNPFLRSDGYQLFTIAVHEPNLRRKAFLVLGQPFTKQRDVVATIALRRRFWYAVYALACITFYAGILLTAVKGIEKVWQ